MYTSFKGFQLVGIWQEKLQIIVITDIKQRIVIIQLVAKQRVVYYCQLKSFPLNGNICSHTIYSSFDSQKLHIFLSFLPIIYISEDFLRQKLVNYSKSNFCFLCNTCRNKSVTYCIQYLAYYCKRGIIIW